MFLTPHTAVALLITTQSNNPFFAFIFGIISHFILDFIPHGDWAFANHKEGRRERAIYMLKAAFIDVLFTVALIYFFVTKYSRPFSPYVLMGAVSGVALPDVLWITIDIFKLKFLYWYIKFHSYVHKLIKLDYSFIYGIPFQIFVVLLIMKIIF